jgi:hypothetical protein
MAVPRRLVFHHLRRTSEKISETAITKTISPEKTKIANKDEFGIKTNAFASKLTLDDKQIP